MNFDTPYDRSGLAVNKWALMERLFGISPKDGIPMWVADMDFRPAPCVQAAAEAVTAIGDYGYFSGREQYTEALAWWTQTRHGWQIDPDWCSLTYGLGNAIAICIQTLTEPGDEVAVFTPVYHEFLSKIERNGRVVRQLPLVFTPGGFEMDFDAYESLMSGRERMMILSSPHNPGGRVWSAAELKAIAAFCEKHDLLLLSDEIHADLVMPGFKHLPFAVACPEVLDRLVMLTSASKTFNIAGLRTGNVIIPDPALRAKIKQAIHGLDMQPNLYGLRISQAAYSPEGAAWVDELMAYLAGNARLFIDAMNAMPGFAAQDMQATYLSWVDLAGTGMTTDEYRRRVIDEARIAPSPGPSENFGKGGETGLRFNLAMPRPMLHEAIARLQAAFADLQ